VSMIDEGSDALVSLSSAPTIARDATPANTNSGIVGGKRVGWEEGVE
jgi:hypothetical protein